MTIPAPITEHTMTRISRDNAFGPRANAYVHSPVHAQGPDLERLEAIARERRPAQVLDLGCGSGHAAFRLALHAGTVTAADVSAGMLQAVQDEAAAMDLENVSTCHADAAALPFDDGTFDLVITRFSAHHWHDFAGGLREARRVLRRDGMAVFIDVIAPESARADTFLQAVELLRDPSHVRNHRLSEWIQALGMAGFAPSALTRRSLRMQFDRWTTRTRTPAVHQQAIRSLQQGAEAELVAAFHLGDDGSFDIEAATLEAAPAS